MLPPPKSPTTTHLPTILTLILLILATPFATPLLQRLYGAPELTATVFFINRLFGWLILALLWLYVRRAARQPLLLWPESRRSPAFYLLSALALLGIIFAGMVVLNIALAFFIRQAVSPHFLAYLKVLRGNIPLLLFTALTAGIVEELLFRGYMQPRLEAVFKRPAPAIIVTSLLFAGVHASYGTVANVLGPLYIGLLFSIFYQRYRNIKVLMLCHFLWDALFLFVYIKRP